MYTVHYWARVFKISSNFKKKSSNFLNDTFLYTKKNTNRKEHQIKNLMHQQKTQILVGTKKNTKKWKAPTFKPIGTKKKSTLGYSKATALHDHNSSSSKIDILNCNENFIHYRIITTYLRSSC